MARGGVARLTFAGLSILLVALAAGPRRGSQREGAEQERVPAAGQALRRGRRGRMEDRAVAVQELNVSSALRDPMSFYAVYDGHEGQAASQHAADALHEAFSGSLASLMAQQPQPAWQSWWPWSRPSASATQPTRAVVRLALQEAFRAVDTAIITEASRSSLSDGTTAVVVVIWGRAAPEAVVAHAGDSKALLCVPHNPKDPSGFSLRANELTEDHTLAREDERERVEAAGGKAISDGRILRLNGDLAVSRSLGDLPYREYGLIGEPELTDVPADLLSEPRALLLLASDGVFETLTPQEACSVAGAVAYPSTCPPFDWTSPPAEAIALGPGPLGESPSVGTAAADEGPEPAMSSRRTGRQHWGLLGCHDCGPGTVLAPSRQSAPAGASSPGLITSPMSSVAAALLKESHNRRSMDNLAAVVVRLGQGRSGDHPQPPRLGLDGDATGQDAGSPLAPKVVGSPASRHHYQLQRLLTLVPVQQSRGAVVRHVSWDGVPVNIETPSQGACEGFDCLVLWDLHGGLDAYGDDGEMSCDAALSEPRHLMELPASASTLLAELASLPMEPQAGLHPELPKGEAGEAGGEDSHGDGRDGQEHLGWVHAEYAEYKLQGAFGEVWRCTRHTKNAKEDGTTKAGGADGAYVLKRLMVEKGAYTRLSGERERYFGELMTRQAEALGTGHTLHEVDGEGEDEDCGLDDVLREGMRHVVRYVESFESQQGRELWLVFRDEGKSLHSLIYEVSSTSSSEGGESEEQDAPLLQVLQPSRWWRAMRSSPVGDQWVLGVIRQVLLALAAVHHSNVTHRDVKPANLLVDFQGSRRAVIGGDDLGHVRLIDFGSAVDAASVFRLYGKHGPSELEQTAEYAPPETTFGRFWTGRPVVARTWPYDIWSAGVVWLELLLGTPHVFQISARTRATLDHALNLRRKRSPEERQQLYLLRGLMELCIYPPLPRPRQAQPPPPVPWSCSDQAVAELLRSRDPTGRGPSSLLAVRLLRSMLDWHPSSRPTALEALRHAVFVLDGPVDDAALSQCSARGRHQAGWC